MGIYRGATGTGTAVPAYSNNTINELEGYADTASTKADEAAGSASNALSSAFSASTSASEAQTSASEAQTSAVAAEAAYDDFDDRYLGDKASDPTVDNDGDPLVTGALYFNTTTDVLRVYNGSSWQDATSGQGGGFLTQTTADTLYEPILTDTTRQQFFRAPSTNPPATASLLEGDMWYETDTENIYFWRETGTNVFSWVLFSTGTDNSDTLDGGNY